MFKPADPRNPFDVIFGQDLDEKGVEDSASAARSATPNSSSRRSWCMMSQAPVLSRDAAMRVEPRCVGLRVFAVATPAGYTVMPGGLTRVAGSASARVVTMQRGGGSKDTWVMSPGQVDTSFTLLRTTGDRRPIWCARPRACHRAWPRTCTGWAATPNAAMTWRACCAWR